MSGIDVVTTALAALVGAALIAWGVAAYLGRPAGLRERMLADPRGELHAAALWLGLEVPLIALLVLLPSGPDGSAGPAHVAVLAVMGLVLAVMVLVAHGPERSALVRSLRPSWLVREREAGGTDADGRPDSR